jgi:hypothetical protein
LKSSATIPRGTAQSWSSQASCALSAQTQATRSGTSEVPGVFGFEGQVNAFYLDPDAFIEAEASSGYLRVTTTFGAIELAGPIRRPDWF